MFLPPDDRSDVRFPRLRRRCNFHKVSNNSFTPKLLIALPKKNRSKIRIAVMLFIKRFKHSSIIQLPHEASPAASAPICSSRSELARSSMATISSEMRVLLGENSFNCFSNKLYTPWKRVPIPIDHVSGLVWIQVPAPVHPKVQMDTSFSV